MHPPIVSRDPEAFRAACNAARARGGSVAIVPTMGALHEGPLSLVREARRRAPFVAVTIFVNPIQFAPGEDLARYPRTLDADLAHCAREGVAHVFAPDAAAMYPPDDRTRVRVADLTDVLCGPHRPGHFEGVTTVVAKLFALAGACAAIFGRKDYQQLQVVRRMTSDLRFPIDVVGMPTVRDPDGLAMSSRNRFLAPPDRPRARALPRGLANAERLFAGGERRAGALRRAVGDAIEQAFDRVDYVEVCDPDSLRVLGAAERGGERLLVAAAARIFTTRLIDNVVLGEDSAPRVLE